MNERVTACVQRSGADRANRFASVISSKDRQVVAASEEVQLSEDLLALKAQETSHSRPTASLEASEQIRNDGLAAELRASRPGMLRFGGDHISGEREDIHVKRQHTSGPANRRASSAEKRDLIAIRFAIWRQSVSEWISGRTCQSARKYKLCRKPSASSRK
jgi:hypothetical protein